MSVKQGRNIKAKLLLIISLIFLANGTQLDAMTIDRETSGNGFFGPFTSIHSQGVSYNELQGNAYGSHSLDSRAQYFWYIGILLSFTGLILVSRRLPGAKPVSFIASMIPLISLIQVVSVVDAINDTFTEMITYPSPYNSQDVTISYSLGTGTQFGFVGVIIGFIAAMSINSEQTPNARGRRSIYLLIFLFSVILIYNSFSLEPTLSLLVSLLVVDIIFSLGFISYFLLVLIREPKPVDQSKMKSDCQETYVYPRDPNEPSLLQKMKSQTDDEKNH